MEKLLIKGDVYTVATKTECTVTSANGTLLGKATAENPVSFTATTDRVELSDPDAEFSRVNPKYAPVKLRLLGLLGGGNSELPEGYLRAEFLESTGTQYIKVELPVTPNTRVVARAAIRNKNDIHSVFSITSSSHAPDGYGLTPTSGSEFPNTFAFNSSGQIYKNLNLVENAPYVFEVDGYKLRFNGTDYPFPNEPKKTFDFFVLFAYGNENGRNILCKKGVIFGFEYFDQTKLKLTPAVNENGIPCMFDTVSKQPLRKNGTGQFITGFTLPQARKLGKLPAGTKLTVSLPVGYDSDAGVVAALAEAEANGCVLTVQTYEAEAGAASTFALRRVWVRKTQDENGTYIAGDGTRWQVEWCVDIIGADPEQEGYEMFRSVDAAVAYWELEPYVNPTREEEILTSNNE